MDDSTPLSIVFDIFLVPIFLLASTNHVDLENSDNQEKQRLQTAAVASKNHSRKLEKQAKAKEVRAKATQMHHRQFIEQVQAQDTEEHPHKPRIDVYLR